MKRALFADTCYWIALLNPRDQLHERAVSVSQSLNPTTIVTTDEVLTEFLNYFAERGALLRQSSIQLVERMQADRTIHIAPQGRETFLAGFRLFRARRDKGYSLTDCISMDCMAKRRLAEVLTNDEHFSQEGFVLSPTNLSSRPCANGLRPRRHGPGDNLHPEHSHGILAPLRCLQRFHFALSFASICVGGYRPSAAISYAV